jgi:hypothetical protein
VNLDYEYSVIMGKRKFTLSYPVSSSCRSASSRMDEFIPQPPALRGMSLVHLVRHHSRVPDVEHIIQDELSGTKLLAPMPFR